MNPFDEIYEIYEIIIDNPPYPDKLGLQLTTSCTNGCEWCCTNCTPYGIYLMINDTLEKLIKHAETLSLTGGEALLHPKFKEIVKMFFDNNGTDLTLITSGINPYSKKELRDTYYDNLNFLSEIANENRVWVSFSFSDGVEPKKRLDNFLYSTKDRNLKIYSFNIVSNEPEKRKNELKEMFKKYNKNDSDRFSVHIPQNSGRQKPEKVYTKDVCNAYKNNDLSVRADGTLHICCKVVEEIMPLIPYANINMPVEEILKRRELYLLLLKEFQEKKGNSCEVCVNKGGFNDFLRNYPR